jgi:cyclopropane-fatty-acyl-phospholipid synthase
MSTMTKDSVVAGGPAASWLERAAAGVVFGCLSRLERGRLELRLPDGSGRTFGPGGGPEARLDARSWRFFTRVLSGGDVGFGEAYTAGDFETPDLTALIRLMIENADALADRYARFAWLGRAADRVAHLLRANTPRNAKSNIGAHYDLGNDMFRLFLDPSLTYSCAYFETPEQSLEDAQRAKRSAVIRKARIEPHHHILEVGSGWGAFAVQAAKETGCRVTTITLSEEQLAHARELVRREGLEDRVKVELCDYRSVKGSFDRIVSIEMIEAVGHEYLGDYFAALDRVLKPEGLVVLQAITIPDHKYETFRKGCDWIQKHIFPGSVIPSLTALSEAMTRRSRFMIEHLENIGVHYAPTLKLWREKFLGARATLEGLGYGREFQRAWEYYFCYSEAGFATRTLGDLQLVLTRPNNRSLPAPEAVAAW